jgi:hypothetical protein
MENQHRKITGYRELTQDEIDMMNCLKETGVQLEKIIAMLLSDENFDKRWINIGATHLQQGLMALTRSVARPTSF